MTGPRRAPRPRTLEEAARARRLDCTRAIACLASAEREDWPSFACGNGCYAPPDDEQRVRDAAGLLMINRRTECAVRDDDDDDNDGGAGRTEE